MSRVFAVTMLSLAVAYGGPKLYLKTRTIDPAEAIDRAGEIKRAAVRGAERGQQRLLIQYDHAPTREDLDDLSEFGIRLLAYVHENGLVVSCDDCSRLDEHGLLWISRLEPQDKISPLLAEIPEDEMRVVVVELHSDVDPNEGRRLVLDQGADLADSPDLSRRHILVRLNPAQMRGLAAREEVAYLFPSVEPLSAGEPVTVCAGALTGYGIIAGQYTAKVGEGWDGPGRGAVTLGYYFQNATAQLPAAAAQAEIVRAFAEWSSVAQIDFTPAPRSSALRTISIQFAARAHDDPYPFDGPGGMLAHTFYPAPPNPEPLAGDLHFDDDEIWRIGASTDLYSVTLHEVGHALGLGHSDQPGSVMYPYYSRQTALSAEDISAVRELYAPRAPASPPEEPVTPTPSEPPVGEPPVQPPSEPETPTQAPLVLNVQPPPAAVVSESIVLIGSVAGADGTAAVSWNTGRGHSGTAVGSASWSAQVPIEMGANQIVVTAADSSRSVSEAVAVERRAPAVSPVILQVTYPSATSAFSVTNGSFTLRGTASHVSGVARVSWTNNRGGSGVASGTASWDSGAIALTAGTNLIAIVATANDGASATRSVQVDYATSTVRDTTSPSVAIGSPSSPTFTTSADSIVLSGTAKDNVCVAEVVWFSSTGPTGKAVGTTGWKTEPIPLMRGYNSIVVRAFDAAGNMGWRSVGVTRQ